MEVQTNAEIVNETENIERMEGEGVEEDELLNRDEKSMLILYISIINKINLSLFFILVSLCCLSIDFGFSVVKKNNSSTDLITKKSKWIKE